MQGAPEPGGNEDYRRAVSPNPDASTQADAMIGPTTRYSRHRNNRRLPLVGRRTKLADCSPMHYKFGHGRWNLPTWGRESTVGERGA